MNEDESGRERIRLQRQAFLEWLRRRVPDASVDIAETHVSFVAFQSDRVFKCKKAVSLPFIDLSTEQLRYENCLREVALNRRFAPDVYLGVVAVTDERGLVIDHAVEMLRLPSDRSLAALVGAQCEAAKVCVEQVADDLARIHASADRSPEIDAAATHAAIARLWQHGFDEVSPYVGTQLDGSVERDIERLVARFLHGRGPLFEARIAAGHVCDGHGDLLAGDVYCLDDRPRLLDCLEFDDHLRWGDVLADVAFLAMDLERLGSGDLGSAFLERYRDRTHDDWPPSLAHLYIAYRAHVRAKVACLTRAEHETAGAEEPGALLALARRHLREGRVRMVLVGGSPGTGKSTVARAVSAALAWPMISSDVVRKQLAGVGPRERTSAALDEGLYTPDWTTRTYEAMLRQTGRLLELGHSVVLDASWAQPRWRDEAGITAASHAADLVAIRCDAPTEVAAARTESRPADPSDAGPEIAQAIAARFAPWPGAFVVDTSGPLAATEAAVITHLVSA
jgi:aminoglycoside phosphotransferase family enzyme/predicted kinase